MVAFNGAQHLGRKARLAESRRKNAAAGGWFVLVAMGRKRNRGPDGQGEAFYGAFCRCFFHRERRSCQFFVLLT